MNTTHDTILALTGGFIVPLIGFVLAVILWWLLTDNDDFCGK